MHEIIQTQPTFEVNFGATAMMMRGMDDMRCRMCN